MGVHPVGVHLEEAVLPLVAADPVHLGLPVEAVPVDPAEAHSAPSVPEPFAVASAAAFAASASQAGIFAFEAERAEDPGSSLPSQPWDRP